MSKSLKVGIIIASVVNALFLASLFVCVGLGYEEPQFSIFITLLMFAFHTDIRILIGSIFTLFFKKKLNINKKCFKVGEKEYRFLVKLGVKKWKDKFVAWNRKQFVIGRRDNLSHGVERALRNNISAEIIHHICFFAGFLAIWIGCTISISSWWIFLLTAILASFICDLPPIMIQRYNRYRLQRVSTHKR